MKLLETKSIKIGDKEYPVRITNRAMIECERLAKKSIAKLESLEDISFLFFCAIKAGGLDITYDAFLDLIDEESDILNRFSDLVVSEAEKKSQVL